jgi:hypothetical protein
MGECLKCIGHCAAIVSDPSRHGASFVVRRVRGHPPILTRCSRWPPAAGGEQVGRAIHLTSLTWTDSRSRSGAIRSSGWTDAHPLCKRGGMSHQDVMTALVEASATLAGLLLVFLGFILTTSGTLDDDVPLAVHKSLQKVSLVLLIAFAIGLSSVAVSAAWLVTAPGGDPLYDTAISLFALQIAGLAAATGWTVRGLLWAGRRKRGMSKGTS